MATGNEGYEYDIAVIKENIDSGMAPIDAVLDVIADPRANKKAPEVRKIAHGVWAKLFQDCLIPCPVCGALGESNAEIMCREDNSCPIPNMPIEF